MNKKTTFFQVIYLIIIILGIIIPFIDYVVVVEMFFLLLPFGIILFLSIIIFIFNLIKYKKEILKQTSTKLIFIIPLFLFTQITSCFLVDKIQNFRSERLIDLLEIKKENYPDSFNTSFGIEYKKAINENKFELKYSRGFMVNEKYDSKNKMWRSYGWND
ncbi:hypothetical protein ACFSX9_01510 [Flavobacterium ardleyense]|uniref:Uncharacterized protein n=1 Tax=Flavobacterium ardleyense TaxID=2038737 RepID=A0ABW5Z3R3_9FLAO